MTAINYVRAEMAAQEIASICAMLRAYEIAQVSITTHDYTMQRLVEQVEKLNEAMASMGVDE